MKRINSIKAIPIRISFMIVQIGVTNREAIANHIMKISHMSNPFIIILLLR